MIEDGRKEPKLRVVIEHGIERVKFPVNMDGTDSEFIRYFLSIMDQQTNEYKIGNCIVYLTGNIGGPPINVELRVGKEDIKFPPTQLKKI